MISPYTATSRFEPAELERLAEESPRLLAAAAKRAVLSANIFAESTRHERYRMRQVARTGMLRAPSTSCDVRYLEGSSACVDDATQRRFVARDSIALLDVSESLSEAIGSFAEAGSRGERPCHYPAVHTYGHPVTSTTDRDEVQELARRVVENCWSLAPSLTSIDVTIHEIERDLLVIGFHRQDARRTLRRDSRVAVVVRGETAGGLVTRVVRGTADASPEWWVESSAAIARELARRSVARPANGDQYSGLPVLLEGGWCSGVWVHEVVGHQLEADNVEREWSVFPKLGQCVSNTALTVTDGPLHDSTQGGAATDDEATPVVDTTLVDAGNAIGLLHDLRTAISFGETATGNGRRQDYRFPPMPRISNLRVSAGADGAGDLMECRPRLIRVRSVSIGRVDAVSGSFSFVADEAEVVEDGEVRDTRSGIVVEGEVRRALRSIALIGSDRSADEGRGRCLKHGQVVDVGVLSPPILIEDLTIRSL